MTGGLLHWAMLALSAILAGLFAWLAIRGPGYLKRKGKSMLGSARALCALGSLAYAACFVLRLVGSDFAIANMVFSVGGVFVAFGIFFQAVRDFSK